MTLLKAKTNVITRIFLCPYPGWVVTYLFAGVVVSECSHNVSPAGAFLMTGCVRFGKNAKGGMAL